MNEPKIVINGHALTPAEAMTVRVALEAYASELREPDALGNDEHGQKMVDLYLVSIDSIRTKIFE